ncbi:hypothetical protein D3C76_685520 [compost metagenome]
MAQRSQRIGFAAQSTGPGRHGVHQQHQADQLRAALQRLLRTEFEGAEGNGDTAGKSAPQRERQRTGHHTLQQPDGHGEQQHAEEVAHAGHPCTTFGQECTTAGTEDHQRRAHAEAEREQLQAAAQGIAGAADIKQQAGQRGRYARRNQQAGKHAKGRRASDGAATGAGGHLVEAVANERRQAQLEDAEHGHGEQREEQRERHQHPGRLQHRLQVELGAEHAHQRAEHGVAGGHRQHVGQRQGQPAHAARTAAQDHPGKDRQHRQHAGRESQAKAGEEEEQDALVQPAAARRALAGSRRLSLGRAADDSRLHPVGDIHPCGFRRIAEALVGAALVGDDQRQRALLRVVQRHLDIGDRVVHLGVAEIFVVMLLARWQLHLAHADVRGVGLEFQAVAVQVVAVGIDEAQAHLLAAALLHAQAEGLGHRQELALGRLHRADRAVRDFVEKASAGGQGDQEQEQGQQAAHGELAISGMAA